MAPEQENESSEIILTKEMFIDHIPSQIQEDYEINPNELGKGGFGIVFQAQKKTKYNDIASQDMYRKHSIGESENNSNSQQISEDTTSDSIVGYNRAIKKICFQKIEDKTMMENQIEILSYLDHPSIVKLYDTYQYKQRLYIVTDLLKGGDLFQLVQQDKKADQDQVRIIFEQLVKAVNYLHSQNICHRDLKLENVLFLDQNTYNLKLIDFGLAYCWEQDMKSQLKQSGQNKKLAGTPDYMSPQILAKDYDQRCDIWAVGVVLFMLLSGVPPFQGDNDQQIMQNIKTINYSLESTFSFKPNLVEQLSTASDLVKDLISKIFVPEDQRITLSEILAHPWFLAQQTQITGGGDSESHQQQQQQTLGHSRSTTSNISVNGNINAPNEKKFRSTKSYDRLTRKASCDIRLGSMNDDNNSDDFGCFDDSEQQLISPESLTVEKLEFFKSLTRIEKLLSIYSVSKLSESITCKCGLEFMEIDKNNDGTISIEDLTEYLFEIEKFSDKQKTEEYFQAMDLSHRGFINYSEYLACVLGFQSVQGKGISPGQGFQKYSQTIYTAKNIKFSDPNWEQDFGGYDQQKQFTTKSTSSVVNHLSMQFINIYNDNVIYELFNLLDKDRDGSITLQDFTQFFSNNGMDEQNSTITEQLELKILHVIKQDAELLQQQDMEDVYGDKYYNQEEPSKESQQQGLEKKPFRLMRTYKGSSDGGNSQNYSKKHESYQINKENENEGIQKTTQSSILCINFKMFKQLLLSEHLSDLKASEEIRYL